MDTRPQEPELNSRGAQIGRAGRWGAATLIFVFGLLIWDRESLFWALLSFGLFALPLALQATKLVRLRTYAIWFGVFLVIQSFLAPYLKSDFVTLLPNMRSSVDIQTDGIPGIPRGLRHVTTDPRGFRASPPVDYRRKRGSRIFAIGGSTTEDIILDDRSTWTHLLQQELDSAGIQAEVINTGVSGLRAKNHLATLEVVARLDPDLILVLVGGNDWNRQIAEHFDPAHVEHGPTALRNTPIGLLLGRLVVKPLRQLVLGTTSSDFQLIVNTREDLNQDRVQTKDRSDLREFRPTAVSMEYASQMEELSTRCRALPVRCIFLTQPHAYSPAPSEELAAQFWMTPPYADYTLDLESMAHVATLYNSYLLALAERDGHPYCDLAPEVPQERRFFFDDMHFTDEGARLVAKVVSVCVAHALAPTSRPGAMLHPHDTSPRTKSR